MALLDTLEALFTRKMEHKPHSSSDKPLPAWLHTSPPDRNLRASDYYSLSLYLRCVLEPVVRISLLYFFLWIGAMVYIGIFAWHLYPVLFHAGRWQTRVWHSVWQALGPSLVSHGFLFIPLVPLAWALFALVLWLPRVLFWNRRARRLFALGQTTRAEEVAEIAAPGASVWPPPPHH